MTKVADILKTISDRVDRLAMWISILYAFLVTVIVLGSVFLRMAGRAPSWTEELARWLLIGIAFVSSSIALKRGGHIGITALVKIIPYAPLVKGVIQISNILVLLFLGYAFWFGMDAAIQALPQTGDIIPVSAIYVKLHIPLGVLMMMVHVLYYAAGIMKSDDPTQFLLSQ
jgi:TRAP-type C4-dicarboxylate transport system permease small subunit